MTCIYPTSLSRLTEEFYFYYMCQFCTERQSKRDWEISVGLLCECSEILMFHEATFRATCLATALRDELQTSLPNVKSSSSFRNDFGYKSQLAEAIAPTKNYLL